MRVWVTHYGENYGQESLGGIYDNREAAIAEVESTIERIHERYSGTRYEKTDGQDRWDSSLSYIFIEDYELLSEFKEEE